MDYFSVTLFVLDTTKNASPKLPLTVSLLGQKNLIMTHQLKSPITNERGEKLVSIMTNISRCHLTDVQASLVLATHESGIVLVKNSEKQVWEIPGGYLEEDENPYNCARRELFEESGLIGSSMYLLALLNIELPFPKESKLKCALFKCQVEGAPSINTREISEVSFWNPQSSLTPISAIDNELLQMYLNE